MGMVGRRVTQQNALFLHAFTSVDSIIFAYKYRLATYVSDLRSTFSNMY